jgi:hypothetical protein
MKFRLILLSVLMVVSLFCGFAIFAAAGGALFPSIHKLSAPLICQGTVEIETIRASYRPGETSWTHYIYCVNGSARQEITIQAVLLTGLLASAATLALLLIFFGRSIFTATPSNSNVPAADLKPGNTAKGSALDRLTELKQLRDGNLISQAEYERKKDEIMKGL